MRFLSIGLIAATLILVVLCRQHRSKSQDETNEAHYGLSSRSNRPISSSPASGKTIERGGADISTDELSGLPASQFKASLDERTLDELYALGRSLQALLRNQPHQFHEHINFYFEHLYSIEKERAFEFILPIKDFNYEVRVFASRFAQDWKDAEPDLFSEYLLSLGSETEPDGAYASAKPFLELLIAPRDQRFQLDYWMEWLDHSTLSEKGELEALALDTVLKNVHLGTDEDFTTLKESYLDHAHLPGLKASLGTFIQQLSQNRPNETLSFLNGLPPGENRKFATLTAIGEMAEAYPEMGADWLSDPEIIGQLSPIEGTDLEGEALFDDLLSTYISRLVMQYPDDALDNIDSIIDPRIQENLRTVITTKAEEIKIMHGLSH